MQVLLCIFATALTSLVLNQCDRHQMPCPTVVQISRHHPRRRGVHEADFLVLLYSGKVTYFIHPLSRYCVTTRILTIFGC